MLYNVSIARKRIVFDNVYSEELYIIVCTWYNEYKIKTLSIFTHFFLILRSLVNKCNKIYPIYLILIKAYPFLFW